MVYMWCLNIILFNKLFLLFFFRIPSKINLNKVAQEKKNQCNISSIQSIIKVPDSVTLNFQNFPFLCIDLDITDSATEPVDLKEYPDSEMLSLLLVDRCDPVRGGARPSDISLDDVRVLSPLLSFLPSSIRVNAEAVIEEERVHGRK